MGKKISRSGSTKRKQILERWKTGEDSIWKLHINATDVNNKLVELQQENEQKLASQYLHGLHLEKELEVAKKEITRKTSENQELKSLLSTAKQDLTELQECSQQLQESSNQQHRSNKRSPNDGNEATCKQKCKRADFEVLSRKQQWSQRKELSKDINQALSFMENDGIKVSTVKFLHTQTNQTEVLDIQAGKFTYENAEPGNTIDCEVVLYVKEKFGLSDAAYHELSMICHQLPRTCQLKALVKEINTGLEIKPCPGGFGVQQSLK